MIPCLIGRDPSQTEDVWQYLYRGAYWRRGPVTMTAIAAVDMALWDIKGKALNTPVYNLIGGKSRTGVLVYGHANGRDIEETVDEVAKYKEQGYLAIRAQSGIPGLASTYGVAKDKMFYEPAEKGLPPENLWSTEKYLLHVPKLFEALRLKFGDDLNLLHDVHHRLTPIEAARLGKSLEPYHLFWLEDAVPAELQEGFRLIRKHTTTPLAVGEVFNSVWDAHILITEQLIDYLRMTVVHSGGLTHFGRSRRWRKFITCGPAATGRRIFLQWRWRRHCTSISPSTTSEFRNTCGIRRRRTRYFRMRIRSMVDICIPAMRRGWASIMTRNWRKNFRMSVRTCR